MGLRDEPVILTTPQAAERLGVRTRWLLDHKPDRGGPPFATIGSRRYYTPEGLDRWASKVQADSEIEAAGLLTALRDEQSAEWERYASRHTEKVLEGARRRRAEMQRLTADAPRTGQPWTQEELAKVMQDRPLVETAIDLGRTYGSVVMARRKMRKMLGLGIEYTKSEADPYDGSDRRGVLYVKDKTMKTTGATQ